jgi:soluble lytic murein transglycosylase-like protein
MKLTIAFISLITALVFSITPTLGGGLKKIVHPDGSVEYTNVSPKKANKGAQTIIYSYSDGQNTQVFTNQKPTNVNNYAILRFDCYACNPNSTINWHHVKLNHGAYKESVKTISAQFNVDAALVRALIHAESAFNPNALSHKGAQGLMQLMPATAKELGVADAKDPIQNIEGGVKYLSALLKQFKGDITLATAAYNAGPGAVTKYDGIPPYKETQVYVERVAILHERYKNAS